MSTARHICFLSDYGYEDDFAGVCRGIIARLAPDVRVIDITHGIVRHDLVGAAFVLRNTQRYMPEGAVHLAVVDPGVGTSRRALGVRAHGQRFVGPDNGLLEWAFHDERCEIRALEDPRWFRHPVSRTFHGRDVFSPIAAWVSKGIEPSNFGPEISDYHRFAGLKPQATSESQSRGIILKADKFGNLITNFSLAEFPQFARQPAPSFRIDIGGKQITTMRNTFGEGEPGELFAILGSTGYLEVVCNRGSAARLLNAAPGTEVVISFG